MLLTKGWSTHGLSQTLTHGLGEMELRVGSNVLIHFSLSIAVFHMAHVLVYYTLLVVIIICIMFVKLSKC